MASTRLPATLQRRRIIERPRLYALLDGSDARVKALVAPAGYGKSTLADQWIARDGRRGVWFTARPSSTDVAGLALGLARTASAIVPGCDERLRAHLKALAAPGENVDVLAEILGEDLGDWPSGGWLVLDEYEQLAGEPEAERFVASLVELSPIQLVIASRLRPKWVTWRELSYDLAVEVNQSQLAMDEAEASEVLAGRSPQSTAGLVELAHGWPAVIGLASVSTVEIQNAADVAESLYEFFAEEVFAAFGDDVQRGLATLAIAPVLDRELAADLLGAVEADDVCAAALDVGILVERPNQLELHPLARAFMEHRRGLLRSSEKREAALKALACYRERREWDAALEVMSRRGLAEELEATLELALDDLLETARLSSIEEWIRLARQSDGTKPIVNLAQAELALRCARCKEAEVLAELAAASGAPDVTFRALSLAGRAAHLASEEETALSIFERAEATARTEQERRDAQWGQLICSTELELPTAEETLRDLTRTVNPSDAREVVRAASCTLDYQVKFGSLDATPGDATQELLGAVSDPLVVSAFQGLYSAVLGLTARYEEAETVASAFLTTVRLYRLDFAVPYALCNAAVADAGRRRWAHAERRCREAARAARSRDANAEQLAYAILVRTLAEQGRHEAALLEAVPSLTKSLLSARADVRGSRALVLASAGRLSEARALVDESRGISRGAVATALVAAVDAIDALSSRSKSAAEAVCAFEHATRATGALDILVAAYRSTPMLLSALLGAEECRHRVTAVIQSVGDDDIAAAAGCPIDRGDPRDRLTPRERDVAALLAQGLTNAQIAKMLFIGVSTVKVHAHHIYAKLGVRSRAELRVQAAIERERQATSAIDETDVDGVS